MRTRCSPVCGRLLCDGPQCQCGKQSDNENNKRSDQDNIWVGVASRHTGTPLFSMLLSPETSVASAGLSLPPTCKRKQHSTHETQVSLICCNCSASFSDKQETAVCMHAQDGTQLGVLHMQSWQETNSISFGWQGTASFLLCFKWTSLLCAQLRAHENYSIINEPFFKLGVFQKRKGFRPCALSEWTQHVYSHRAWCEALPAVWFGNLSEPAHNLLLQR